MSISVDDFVQRLIVSGLLGGKQIRALSDTLPLASAPLRGDQAAFELVKRGILTPFQANEIEEGRHENLVLGNYVLLDKLGEGGMGVVYKAHHRRMKRTVALKVLSPAVTRTREVLRRFEREIEAVARLSHPNIVHAYDSDEHGDTHFLVMEYVIGKDLETVLREYGPQPTERVIGWILQAARGLDYAHRNGLIHRDIKPGNLLLDRQGTIKILDMGLARIEFSEGKDDELTQSGQVMGTVDYMAPEQATDVRSADARSDIYSLGCTLYRLLTDKPLYEGESFVRKLLAHRESQIPSLTDLRLDVPPAVETIFRKMVAKQPADRFQTMAELVTALEGVNAEDTATTSMAGLGGDSPQLSGGGKSALRDTVNAGSVDHRTVRIAHSATRFRWPYAAIGGLLATAALFGLITFAALTWWRRPVAPGADAVAKSDDQAGSLKSEVSKPLPRIEALSLPITEMPVPAPVPIVVEEAVPQSAKPSALPPLPPEEPAETPSVESSMVVESGSGLTTPAIEELTDSRLPIPPEEALKDAEKQVREVFADQFADAKAAEARTRLISDLEEQGTDLINSPDVRYAALSLAESVAIGGSDVERAIELVERRGQDFDISVPQAKVVALSKMLEAAPASARSQAMAVARREFKDLAPTDEYQHSLAMGRIALEFAKAAQDKDAIEEITELGREVRTRQEAFDQVETALRQIEKDPSDAAAHLIAGRWFWFVKDDVATGLQHLAAGNDQQLAEAAKTDIARPIDGTERLSLADTWLSLAEGQEPIVRRRLLERADHWYEFALPELGGLDKARAENQRTELAEELQPPSSEPPKNAVARKTTKVAKTPAKSKTRSRTALYRSFLGVYMYWLDRKKAYPVINLEVPNSNLWTQEIQDRVRGRISFDEISYIGTAKIAVPSDGVYVLTAPKAKVLINGVDTGGSGDIKIRRGIHTLTYEIGTHGQPYLGHGAISLYQKDTGIEVPFFNTWQDIQRFVNAPIAGKRPLEVSGWEPSDDRELMLDSRSLTPVAPSDSANDSTRSAREGNATETRR